MTFKQDNRKILSAFASFFILFNISPSQSIAGKTKDSALAAVPLDLMKDSLIVNEDDNEKYVIISSKNANFKKKGNSFEAVNNNGEGYLGKVSKAFLGGLFTPKPYDDAYIIASVDKETSEITYRLVREHNEASTLTAVTYSWNGKNRTTSDIISLTSEQHCTSSYYGSPDKFTGLRTLVPASCSYEKTYSAKIDTDIIDDVAANFETDKSRSLLSIAGTLPAPEDQKLNKRTYRIYPSEARAIRDKAVEYANRSHEHDSNSE